MMIRCKGCRYYEDCAARQRLTWPCGTYYPASMDREAEYLDQFRELTIMIPFERLKELAKADARGMVLLATIPIGTTVYQLSEGERKETRIIDGEEYTRKVPNWHITRHAYS